MVSRNPTILERALAGDQGAWSPELIRHLLNVDFPKADQARYQQLAASAQTGDLSESERAELEQYLDANDVLTILRAKARAASGRSGPSVEAPRPPAQQP